MRNHAPCRSRDWPVKLVSVRIVSRIIQERWSCSDSWLALIEENLSAGIRQCTGTIGDHNDTYSVIPGPPQAITVHNATKENTAHEKLQCHMRYIYQLGCCYVKKWTLGPGPVSIEEVVRSESWSGSSSSSESESCSCSDESGVLHRLWAKTSMSPSSRMMLG
jgi:hypothetical protein